MPVTISVSGTSTLIRSPELATVHLRLSHSSSSQAESSNAVTTTFNALVSEVKASRDPPLTYKSGTLSTRTHLEWNEETKKSDIRVHHASITLSITFEDFKQLGEMVLGWSCKEYVLVERIHWQLKKSTREGLQQESRQEAVKEALLKAKHYAGALGLEKIDCLEIADPETGGSFGGGDSAPAMARGGMRMMCATPGGGGGGDGLEFTPEDIEIRANVHAKFVAS